MPALNYPNNTRDGLSEAWAKFHGQTARKLNAAGQVALITAPDATNLASVIVLANALKVAVNAVIGAMDA